MGTVLVVLAVVSVLRCLLLDVTVSKQWSYVQCSRWDVAIFTSYLAMLTSNETMSIARVILACFIGESARYRPHLQETKDPSRPRDCMLHGYHVAFLRHLELLQD